MKEAWKRTLKLSEDTDFWYAVSDQLGQYICELKNLHIVYLSRKWPWDSQYEYFKMWLMQNKHGSLELLSNLRL